MAICPDCQKQELVSGESKCPRCEAKSSNFAVKTAEICTIIVAGVGLAIWGWMHKDGA